ncbi:bifunctional methylenetetrahydrofolate dehydrogenase/methenyltetrahydrofolate cyclohydrolase FolD [Pararhizobium mangrovi]|uniref:Bifunctional protein FolD n=1 Tax=Pararhizobium mangrovi TaxID=2590452 RepID=A0A506TVS9_9HYPH|nr:bifunctional methylenetetrahydrofolate dehydrogenase/methenyltetrahydrofolate cyclohydrolase FolD [Pararhizobium mangrovi]TPW26182.1 bifunctional methylenetetrahydrofolate dehydrogenase/methenyltetrahydrofolate cyclohydrolase FolD [Pararhizobium mangrovi]
MASVIDGKAAATAVLADVTAASERLKREAGVQAGLAVVIVGDDPASHVYVASKGKRAEACGFRSVQHTLPADTEQADLLALVERLNADEAIHGILVQLPLPGHLDASSVTQAIRPEKDVDGLTVVNAGKLMSGDRSSGLVSCTPAGAMRLVRDVHGEDLSGLEAVVVGRSNLFGKPMGQLLLAANATVTMAHSRTADLSAVCRRADILVAATGRAGMVRGDWIKPGATIIDVGITRIDAPERGPGKTRLVGDVAHDEAEAVAGAMTPVPGGVGPMTIAMLMANTVIAACRQAGIEAPSF